MSKSRSIGTAWESRVVEYLKERGFLYAERRALSGSLDRGDITGVPGVMFECKAEKQINLSQYMNECRAQKKNAGAQVGVAVIKRRSHNVDRAYVVLELVDFIDLIQ